MEYLLLWALLQINTVDPSVGYPADLPKVEYKTDCFLYNFHTGKECPYSWDETTLRPAAIYRPDIDTIYLWDGFNEGRLFDQSVLIHEMYHYIQDISGSTLKAESQGVCPGEAWEKDAYKMQFDWLESVGADPFVVTGLNEISLKLITSCGSYY